MVTKFFPVFFLLAFVTACGLSKSEKKALEKSIKATRYWWEAANRKHPDWLYLGFALEELRGAEYIDPEEARKLEAELGINDESIDQVKLNCLSQSVRRNWKWVNGENAHEHHLITALKELDKMKDIDPEEAKALAKELGINTEGVKQAKLNYLSQYVRDHWEQVNGKFAIFYDLISARRHLYEIRDIDEQAAEALAKKLEISVESVKEAISYNIFSARCHLYEIGDIDEQAAEALAKKLGINRKSVADLRGKLAK